MRPRLTPGVTAVAVALGTLPLALRVRNVVMVKAAGKGTPSVSGGGEGGQ